MNEKPILLIGPLPPDYGGARTSFFLFFHYVKSSGTAFRYFDLPVLSFQNKAETGKVDHIRTVLGILTALFFIPRCSSIVIFGSRNFAFFYSIPFILLGRFLKKQCCIRFFGGRPMLTFIERNGAMRWIVLSLFRLVSKISLETELGAKEFPAFLQNKIEVIPGYRPIVHVSENKRTDEDRSVRFVYAGGITSEKGANILKDAFCQIQKKVTSGFQSAELHLYGNGSKHIIEDLQSVPGIHFHGKVDNTTLRSILPSYDVFVFPSVYNNEGHPGVLIEALMAGLPIIATDLPVIKESLLHGVNAHIVKPGSIIELSRAMEILAADNGMRERLSFSALESSRLFDAEIILPRLAAAFGIKT